MNINISIDDVSPHPLSSVKVLNKCFELIKEFPDIKFSLFVPIAYWRTVRPEISTKEPLQIDAFPEFCEILRNLPKNNFEICYHGLFHGIPGKNDNDEFQNLSEEDAVQKFLLMFEIVKNSKLEEIFKPIFRPPAWRMSPGSIEAAKRVGIRTLALSPKDYARQTYQGADNSFPQVVYYDFAPPFENLEEKEKVEIVYHACEWDKNYLSDLMRIELSNWIKAKGDVTFSFIEGIL